jgi:hypothetical protein
MTAQGGTPVGIPLSCNTYNTTGSSPVAGSMVCSAGDVFAASGTGASDASPGHVGASATVATTGGAAAAHVDTAAIYSDVFVFHSSDPALTNTNVALNLNVAGSMAVGGPFAFASVDLRANVNTVEVGKIFSSLSSTASASCSSSFSGGGGCTGSAFAGGSLVSAATSVPLDQPVLVQLFLAVSAGGSAAGSSANSQFGQSLDFPIGSALFILAGGVTANASDSFVTDNIFAPPGAATPLPAALPLFASGLGALGLLGWRRKKKSAVAH